MDLYWVFRYLVFVYLHPLEFNFLDGGFIIDLEDVDCWRLCFLIDLLKKPMHCYVLFATYMTYIIKFTSQIPNLLLVFLLIFIPQILSQLSIHNFLLWMILTICVTHWLNIPIKISHKTLNYHHKHTNQLIIKLISINHIN